MIIIDEQAEPKLVTALERLRESPDSSRCVHVMLSRLSEGRGASQNTASVVRAAEQILSTENSQIFLCEDGDVFILASSLSLQESQQLEYYLARALGGVAAPDWYQMTETRRSVNALLLTLEEKLEQQKAAREKNRQQREAELTARKREKILNIEALAGADPARIAARRAGRSNLEIMVVEDDLFIRRLVEGVLRKNHGVTSLGDASAALMTYARVAPDLLLLDINLPDVTGHDLLEKIMQMDPAAFVVMLSGNSDRENVMQAVQRGAKGFIAKPFTREKLMEYVGRCPAKQQLQHQ